MRKFITRFRVRKNSHMRKKGWRNIHIIIDIRTRAIPDYIITYVYMADAYVVEDILNDMIDALYRDIGDACFDATYLTRKMVPIPCIAPYRVRYAESNGS